MANWEENEDVLRYLNNNENTIDDIAKAYYVRDVNGFDLNFRDVFNNAINKLNFNTDKLILNKYIAGLPNINKDITYTEFYNNQINSSEIKEKVERLENLKEYLDNNNHLGFYQNLTKYELEYLGW